MSTTATEGAEGMSVDPPVTEVGVQEHRKRRRSARAEVSFFFIGISLLSVLVLSVFNYVAARQLINGIVETTLIDIGSTRGARIESGVGGLTASTAMLAADLGVVGAVNDLADGYAALNQPITTAQLGELREFYEGEISELGIPGVALVSADELMPVSDRAQYLQYHYVVKNPHEPEERAEFVDAGDGSEYSAAHALHHSTLREMRDALGFGDLMLIDASTGSVVYTVDKRGDLGTNLVTGPHRESGLAAVILDNLNEAATGEAVVIDFQPYLPAGGAPTLFVAAAIRDDRELVGVVAVEISHEAVAEVTTAGGDWEGTGLGETGEVYIVGSDSLMRSDSRLWLEEPVEYLDRLGEAGHAPELGAAVDAFGTTVLIQPVDTEAVDAALAGDLYVDQGVNYLGDKTFSAAGPLDVGSLGWVVVAEASQDEVYAPLGSLLRRMLVLAAILVPILIAFGFYLATRMLRPVAPILEAAGEVSFGDLEVELPVHSRDEFGDLAENFNGLVEAMRHEDAALAQAETETSELLSAVVPSRLVDEVQSGDDVARAVRNITVIAMALDVPEVDDPLTQQLIVDHGVAVAAAITGLAEEHGVEPLRSSAAQLVYASGFDVSDAESGRALGFALAARDLIRALGARDEIETDFRAGLAAGDVVTGVVGADRMYFDVWGAPRRQAADLADKAEPGQILVDATAAENSGDDSVGEAVEVGRYAVR